MTWVNRLKFSSLAIFGLALSGEAWSQMTAPSVIEPPVIVEEFSDPDPSCLSAHTDVWNWSDTEIGIYQEICGGWDGTINLSWWDEADLPCNPAEIEGEVPENRIITGKFLQTLLRDEVFLASMARPRLSLRCAMVDGPLDLSCMHLPVALSFSKTWFNDEVDFLFARFDRTVNFSGSQIDGTFDANGANFAQSFHFRYESYLAGSADFINASFSG